MAYVTADKIYETRAVADVIFELIPLQRANEVLPEPKTEYFYHSTFDNHEFLRVSVAKPYGLLDAKTIRDFYLKLLRQGYSLCADKKLFCITIALPVLPLFSSIESPHKAFDIAFRAEKIFSKEIRGNDLWSRSDFNIIFSVSPEDFPNVPENFFELISFIDKNSSYAEEIYFDQQWRDARFSFSRKKPDFSNLEETFSEKLLALIAYRYDFDEVACYTQARVDRRLFSKIRSNKEYRPEKQTALAFAIALRLNITETEDLLKSAGYSLSKGIRYDLAIRFFIEHEIYNFDKINELLFCYGFPLFGCKK